MSRALKMVGAGVAGVVGLVAVVGGGGFVYAGSATNARLAHAFTEVQGKDLPIPFPLTEAEVEALRQEKLAALAAAAAATASAEPAAEPAALAKLVGGEGEQAPEEPAPDPLAGVDLGAIAMERAVARGKALVNGRLPCGECHGADGGGKLVADAQPVWTWYAPNITKGGKTKDYKPADWDRLIRHGVKPDGTPATMPAVDFMSLSDQEVSDLAAYYASLPPIEAQQPAIEIGPLGRFLIGFGQIPLSAEEIDHAKQNPVYPPAEAVNVEYGGHVAATCVGCHGLDFVGGPIKQGPPDWPPAQNLTPHADGLAGWTEEEFIRVFREGKSKDGTALREPMASMTKMNVSDTDLKAMFVYLQQLEGKPDPK